MHARNITHAHASTPCAPQGEAAVKVSHDIRTNKDGSLYISDVTRRSVEPTDLTEIDSILELAARQRSVGVTDMNAQVRSPSCRTLRRPD